MVAPREGLKNWLIGLVSRYVAVAKCLQPALLLAVRFWVGMVFFTSGIAKLGDWETALALFQYEHPVPGLPPLFAAIVGTLFEVACPVLLFLGLGTRFAALPLIGMTLVIEFTYMHHKDHQAWALMLFTLLVFGAGKWSADAWLEKRFSVQS